jgi:TPR repeat protein
MRTSRLALAAFTALGAVALADPAAALDAPATAALRPPAPVAGFGSVRDAVRSGMRDYNAGNKTGAAQALEYAGKQGDSLALWKLGRMYADGDGVPHDDLKAFESFSKIADDFSKAADERPEETLDPPNAAVVASAYVALGAYFLDGIRNTYVKPNPRRAYEMFYYAASNFSDASAQYSLARLYLEGTGVAKDPLQAARWLNLAALKGHHHAQALLGHLLVTGQGIRPERPLGLMWLTVARDAAAVDPVKDQWILALYDKAFAGANDRDRQKALDNLEQFLKRKR